MSYDVGNNGMAPDYEIKARLRAAMEIEGMSWSQLLVRAGVAEDEVVRAIEQGVSGLGQNQQCLARLAHALGRDLNWLLTGAAPFQPPFLQGVLERVLRLTWEYIYKLNVDKFEWNDLLERVRALVSSLKCNTMQGAYRAGIPRTWQDVGWIHRQLVKDRVRQSRPGGREGGSP